MASSSSVNPPDHNTRVSSQVTLTTPSIVAPPDGGLYDVFLSFRGETRSLFVDHLHNVLQRSQLRAYIDKRDLLPGGVISTELINAIKNSKTYVVVFSQDYAGSPWCLNELVQIYKCYEENKNLVIGVYYHIIPSDVRHQKGNFDKSFKEHETGYYTNQIDLVNEWRRALKGVANFSGLEISAKSDDINKVDFINKIAELISRHVKPKTLHVADHYVARRIVQDMKNTITASLSSETVKGKGVIKIGLHGLGGVGKTTLAKDLYNHLLEISDHVFDACCFLYNLREDYGCRDGLLLLQNKLISGLLNSETTNEVRNDAQGTNLMKTRFVKTKVLLIIDDVDNFEQCKSLMGPYADGSVVIITTRDTTILDKIQVETTHRFEVNIMNDAESLKLFTAHAFPDAEPNNSLMELFGKKILNLAGGLPLALQVFGSYLSTESSDDEWDDYIKKLNLDPNSTIVDRLMISLDAMDDPILRDIFIDIACFFHGMKLNEVVKIMETCFSVNVDLNIRKLRKRSLLTIYVDNYLGMHDLLQDVGRKVARDKFSRDEPEKHSRLWKLEDICKVLLKEKGTDSIQGIIPSNFNYHDRLAGVKLPATIFQKMSKLRFLYIKDVELTGSFKDTFEDLTWFRWDCCLLTELPSHFLPERLVVLELHDSKIQNWELNKVFVNLKTLNMSNSINLTTMPDFAKLPNLETLTLNGCESLEKVDIPNDSLTKLVSFHLRDCVKLRSIKLISPSSLGVMEVLDVSRCEKLETLPHQLCEITSLRNIYLGTYSREYFEAPFKHLKLSHIFFTALPSFYSHFVKVEHLGLFDWPNLLSIEQLPPNLKKLTLCGCKSLVRLPNLFTLTQLEHLELLYSSSLMEIQGLEKLTSIRELYLDGCNSSLHANILTTPFFQNWSQVGSRIIISAEELPSWFTFIHCGVLDNSYTIPSDVGQISSMIICLQLNCDDEFFNYECDVENVTTGEKYSDDEFFNYEFDVENVTTGEKYSDEFFNYEFDVENVTTGEKYSEHGTTLGGRIYMIILPTSIISLQQGDIVKVISDGLVRGIHLV